MARLDLIGGAYAARSVIANAQRCINLYSEKNREDSPVPFTYYQRPGLKRLSGPPSAGQGRGILRDSQGNGYAVVGQKVYSLSADLKAWTLMGSLLTAGTVPVSLSDNGVTAVLGDASPQGYQWPIGTPSGFTQIIDNTGIFVGTNKWDTVDGFLLWVEGGGSAIFASTYDNELVFDPTWYGIKAGYPDPLVTLWVNRRIIILLGLVRSEIWYDAGAPLFPFAVQPGAYIEWGCLAPYSVAQIGITVIWLAQNLQGQNVVVQQEGYNTTIISNHAISNALDRMAAAGADLTDATAYTYVQGGHIFYVLTFQSGNETWVYDASIGNPAMAWHQRGWTDGAGRLNRERAMGGCPLNGLTVVQDWENGDLYSLDLNTFVDEVGGVAGPITCVRTFPQLKQGYAVPRGATGFGRMAIPTDGHGVMTVEFTADFECGNGPINPNGEPASIGLRWSIDRGKTWGNTVLQSIGRPGEFAAQAKWPNLGYARYPLFELSWSFPAQATLNGAWIEPVVTSR